MDNMPGMIDAKSLLNQFLGSGGAGAKAPGGFGDLAGAARQALDRAGGAGGFVGGTAAGGLLGTLLSGKKGKKGGALGGVLSHGGAALLGAMAHRAYQDWQQGSAPATVATAPPHGSAAAGPGVLPAPAPAGGGQAFELALVRAMIGAAKADGHVDAAEQQRIFGQVERLGLDAEAKAFVFDALAAPTSVAAVAAAAGTPEQAAELYLASRLAIDPDQPAERAYLEALAHRLALPPGLAVRLDQQAEEATRSVTL